MYQRKVVVSSLVAFLVLTAVARTSAYPQFPFAGLISQGVAAANPASIIGGFTNAASSVIPTSNGASGTASLSAWSDMMNAFKNVWLGAIEAGQTAVASGTAALAQEAQTAMNNAADRMSTQTELAVAAADTATQAASATLTARQAAEDIISG